MGDACLIELRHIGRSFRVGNNKVVKAVDNEVDKIVNAILKDSEEELAETA